MSNNVYRREAIEWKQRAEAAEAEVARLRAELIEEKAEVGCGSPDAALRGEGEKP